MHGGQRHLGGGDGPQVVALEVVGVVGELGQMAGRDHGLGQHHGRAGGSPRRSACGGRGRRRSARAAGGRRRRGRAGTSSPTAGRPAPCRAAAGPRRSPSAAPAGASARPGSAAPVSWPGHQRRISTLSASLSPVGHLVGRDVGQVEQALVDLLPLGLGLGRRGALLLAQPAALRAAAPRPGPRRRAFLASPTWRG